MEASKMVIPRTSPTLNPEGVVGKGRAVWSKSKSHVFFSLYYVIHATVFLEWFCFRYNFPSTSQPHTVIEDGSGARVNTSLADWRATPFRRRWASNFPSLWLSGVSPVTYNHPKLCHDVMCKTQLNDNMPLEASLSTLCIYNFTGIMESPRVFFL